MTPECHIDIWNNTLSYARHWWTVRKQSDHCLSIFYTILYGLFLMFIWMVPKCWRKLLQIRWFFTPMSPLVTMVGNMNFSFSFPVQHNIKEDKIFLIHHMHMKEVLFPTKYWSLQSLYFIINRCVTLNTYITREILFLLYWTNVCIKSFAKVLGVRLHKRKYLRHCITIVVFPHYTVSFALLTRSAILYRVFIGYVW